MEWTPDHVEMSCDGKSTFRFDKESDDPAVWPYAKPQYLIMNLAIGGGWGGQKGIDDAIFPARYEIDYVRVYQKE
jgi:beta-glucanase (GH16 family)